MKKLVKLIRGLFEKSSKKTSNLEVKIEFRNKLAGMIDQIIWSKYKAVCGEIAISPNLKGVLHRGQMVDLVVNKTTIILHIPKYDGNRNLQPPLTMEEEHVVSVAYNILLPSYLEMIARENREWEERRENYLREEKEKTEEREKKEQEEIRDRQEACSKFLADFCRNYTVQDGRLVSSSETPERKSPSRAKNC